MGSTGRLIMTGVREAGCTEFRFTVYGNADRRLPPAVLLASLLEFRSWLTQAQGSVNLNGTPGENPTLG